MPRCHVTAERPAAPAFKVPLDLAPFPARSEDAAKTAHDNADYQDAEPAAEHRPPGHVCLAQPQVSGRGNRPLAPGWTSVNMASGSRRRSAARHLDPG